MAHIIISKGKQREKISMSNEWNLPEIYFVLFIIFIIVFSIVFFVIVLVGISCFLFIIITTIINICYQNESEENGITTKKHAKYNDPYLKLNNVDKIQKTNDFEKV